MLRRSVLFTAAVMALFFVSSMAWSETIEEAKERIRREVESEMAPRKEPLPPSPASAKDTYPAKKKVKQEINSGKKQAQAGNTIEIPVPFDITPELAFRLAFVTMFFALIPAVIARMKGRSFIAWWVLGALFFIFVMPIAVFMRPMKRLGAEPHPAPPPKAPEKVPVKVEKSWEPPSVETDVHKDEGSSAIEVYAKIENLAKLKDKGVITEDEFKAKKNELLSRI